MSDPLVESVGEVDVPMARKWAMPNKWTFEITPIGELVKTVVAENDGLWLDPFAGKARVADVTNDLHPDRDTDYSMKAVNFLGQIDDGEVDGGVIFDPPYSAEQLSRQYEDAGMEPNQDETNGGFYGRNRDEIARVCAPGATVLTCGWDSTGVGKGRGFEKQEILLVCHGSSRNDTICVIEEYRGGDDGG